MSDRRPTPRPHVLLSGGGSGGHVFPALAVGEALAARGLEVSFAGSASGLEARLVPQQGVRFHALPARAFVGRGPLARLAALAVLLRSALAARALVRREQVAVTLGTGGYASVPAVLGSWLARRPAVLLEPNAEAGAANRTLSRIAVGACVAAGAAPRLSCPLWETGVPVRASFRRAAAPSGRVRLLVLGGSQGSLELNLALPVALATADPERQVKVLHQVGRDRLDAARATWGAVGRDDVEVAEFVDDVAGAMAASHLVVSRAGAITLAELCAVGRGAVLVPLAAAGAHQRANAELLVERGAAELLTSGPGLDERLAPVLARLLSDPAALERMAAAAAELGRPGAAADIADRLLALLPERAA